MKRIKFSDDNFLKILTGLKQGERVYIEFNSKKIIGVESIKALDTEYIFVGLYDNKEENQSFAKLIYGDELDFQDDFEADIIEYIDELLDEYMEGFNPKSAFLVIV